MHSITQLQVHCILQYRLYKLSSAYHAACYALYILHPDALQILSYISVGHALHIAMHIVTYNVSYISEHYALQILDVCIAAHCAMMSLTRPAILIWLH